MDKITALLEFLPEDWKAATVIILIVFYFSFRLLKNDINNIEKVLGEKIGHIDKQLSNHITETNDKIKELKADVKELKSGQADLAVKIAEGQAKLETKISDGQAELYKLLSLKSPDKKK